jgi:hypothetical protein
MSTRWFFYAQLWLERRSAWFQINLLGGPGLFITLMKSWHNILKPREKKNWVIYHIEKFWWVKSSFEKTKPKHFLIKTLVRYLDSSSATTRPFPPRPAPPRPRAPLLSKTQNGKLGFRYLTLKFHLLCLI